MYLVSPPWPTEIYAITGSLPFKKTSTWGSHEPTIQPVQPVEPVQLSRERDVEKKLGIQKIVDRANHDSAPGR